MACKEKKEPFGAGLDIGYRSTVVANLVAVFDGSGTVWKNDADKDCQ